MKYLLDTQVLIFLGSGDENRIGANALKIFKNSRTDLYISQISYWEIAIKINIGKLHIPIGLEKLITLTRDAGIKTIMVNNDHILNYQNLEAKENHKDPFDRFIISVALCEKMKVMTNDRKFDLYKNLKRVWQ